MHYHKANLSFDVLFGNFDFTAEKNSSHRPEEKIYIEFQVGESLTWHSGKKTMGSQHLTLSQYQRRTSIRLSDWHPQIQLEAQHVCLALLSWPRWSIAFIFRSL
jgi:hypothetical protein